MSMGGPPARNALLVNAVRLGLELENDVRVASDRINQLKPPRVPTYVPLPRIVPPPPPPIDSDPPRPSDDPLQGMPLL